MLSRCMEQTARIDPAYQSARRKLFAAAFELLALNLSTAQSALYLSASIREVRL